MAVHRATVVGKYRTHLTFDLTRQEQGLPIGLLQLDHKLGQNLQVHLVHALIQSGGESMVCHGGCQIHP